MSIHGRVGGVTKTGVLRTKYAGAVRRVKTGRVKSGGTVSVFYSNAVAPLSVSITADTFIIRLGSGSATMTAEPITAVVTGGTGPFSYAYTVVSYTGSLPTINVAGFATTGLSKVVPQNANQTATIRVTVTDSLGATATADLEFTFDNSTGV